MERVRCAIYTRKSSEEGLEQAFNSLHAQREACAAYVASQRAEGWVLLPYAYDDGGLSGGTLERPAMQRLLEDVDAGRVDQIVVYKIDRLTRSLADFAKIVDRLDGAGASFVSVTQSFNTATSMGRLTLNMLLSFAQFEREVTAERRGKFPEAVVGLGIEGGEIHHMHIAISAIGAQCMENSIIQVSLYGVLHHREDPLNTRKYCPCP